ncbi:MAG TPA: protein kinase [Candidatus Acidoferrales bacterium]|nr:protein kinase [Candidatus Acidoferrales bacterium]
MIGKTISHYRISAELGRGGMGVVYRAHDERLLRSVAIKILSDASCGSAETRSRTLAEARAASSLNHPGITTIYEVGEDGDSIFLVMELVEGRSLRSLLSDGPLDPKRIVEIGAQLAEALDAAHSRGVFHGDIKPENIVVQADGRAKLLDFGVARGGVEDTLTKTVGAVVESDVTPGIQGTIAYLAPEQLRCEPADGRADLHSLGVVFYELASGRRPFTAPSFAALISQIISGSAPRLKGAAPGAPSGLCDVVEKLLEKEPARRFQTARDLQRELTNLARELELAAFLPAALAGQRSVAVLPFKLLTPNPNDEYLSMALADAVINHLSATGELLVRPGQSVARYAQRETDPLSAARDLNVHIVVDGSIQKVGTKLRVHVRAWSAADGSVLLSAKHDAEAADLFHLQDSITEGIGKSLGLKHQPNDDVPAGPPTKNPIAYELYLRAADRLFRLNSWDNRAAIDMLENAVKLDPKFAEAWARLAEALMLVGTTSSASPHWVVDAEKALRKAIALDPDNAEAHCAKGRILWSPARKFQNGPALRALARALRLNPGCHPARVWQALIFNHIGMLKEAKEGLLIALAARPDDAFTNVFLGHTALSMWNFEEAEECLQRALRHDPVNIWANVFQPTVFIYSGKLNEAESRIQAAQNVLPDDPWLHSCEALLWALRGERTKAAHFVHVALHSKTKPLLHTHHMWHTAAAALALLGKPAPAVELLEKAGGFGLPNYELFRDDKFLKPLAGKQRYDRLLAKLKREDEGYRREFAPAS